MAKRIFTLRRRVVSAGAAACGLALLAVMASAPAQASGAARPGSLTLLSIDPYTNSFSAHKTEVEPDTFSSGKTIVSAFQVGRVFNGASANIGFATSSNGGRTWSHGFLPASTSAAVAPCRQPGRTAAAECMWCGPTAGSRRAARPTTSS
jgi:hypothetical protein